MCHVKPGVSWEVRENLELHGKSRKTWNFMGSPGKPRILWEVQENLEFHGKSGKPWIFMGSPGKPGTSWLVLEYLELSLNYCPCFHRKLVFVLRISPQLKIAFFYSKLY